MKYPDTKLIIFSKAPVPGYVKTRLTPPLSKSFAANLHSYMLEQTVKLAQQSNLSSVDLYCAPDIEHDFFKYLERQYSVNLKPQSGIDLGERMFNALNDALNTHISVVLTGTDCPAMQVDYLQQAFEKLATNNIDIVIGPVEDGGYALIGATKINRQLFENIDWSTDRVFTQSIEKINQLGWKYHTLDTLWDLDTPADLQRLPENYLQQIPERIA